jgi:hypothetical protein
MVIARLSQLNLLLRADLPEFSSLAQDASDHRGSNGRTRSSGASMTFVQNDDIIEQLSSTVSYPTFGNTVLPQTSEAGNRRRPPPTVSRV